MTAIRLPTRLQGERLLLHPWRDEDAAGLGDAIGASLEQLRPWMPWIAGEPQTIGERRALFARWEEESANGGDGFYGVFLDGAVAGGCGLHRRIGAGGLEIGYWIATPYTRRGFATESAALLTTAAFTLPAISRVEIHHDRANEASAGVPRRLGFKLIDERRDEPTAPADTGIECIWRVEREAWRGRAP